MALYKPLAYKKPVNSCAILSVGEAYWPRPRPEQDQEQSRPIGPSYPYKQTSHPKHLLSYGLDIAN